MDPGWSAGAGRRGNGELGFNKSRFGGLGLVVTVLEIKPRISHMPHKCPPTELHCPFFLLYLLIFPIWMLFIAFFCLKLLFFSFERESLDKLPKLGSNLTILLLLPSKWTGLQVYALSLEVQLYKIKEFWIQKMGMVTWYREYT